MIAQRLIIRTLEREVHHGILVYLVDNACLAQFLTQGCVTGNIDAKIVHQNDGIRSLDILSDLFDNGFLEFHFCHEPLPPFQILVMTASENIEKPLCHNREA